MSDWLLACLLSWTYFVLPMKVLCDSDDVLYLHDPHSLMHMLHRMEPSVTRYGQWQVRHQTSVKILWVSMTDDPPQSLAYTQLNDKISPSMSFGFPGVVSRLLPSSTPLLFH